MEEGHRPPSERSHRYGSVGTTALPAGRVLSAKKGKQVKWAEVIFSQNMQQQNEFQHMTLSSERCHRCSLVCSRSWTIEPWIARRPPCKQSEHSVWWQMGVSQSIAKRSFLFLLTERRNSVLTRIFQSYRTNLLILIIASSSLGGACNSAPSGELHATQVLMDWCLMLLYFAIMTILWITYWKFVYKRGLSSWKLNLMLWIDFIKVNLSKYVIKLSVLRKP